MGDVRQPLRRNLIAIAAIWLVRHGGGPQPHVLVLHQEVNNGCHVVDVVVVVRRIKDAAPGTVKGELRVPAPDTQDDLEVLILGSWEDV